MGQIGGRLEAGCWRQAGGRLEAGWRQAGDRLDGVHVRIYTFFAKLEAGLGRRRDVREPGQGPRP